MTKLSMSGGLLLVEAIASSLTITSVGSDHSQFAAAIAGVVLAAVLTSLQLANELFHSLNGSAYQPEDQTVAPYS